MTERLNLGKNGRVTEWASKYFLLSLSSVPDSHPHSHTPLLFSLNKTAPITTPAKPTIHLSSLPQITRNGLPLDFFPFLLFSKDSTHLDPNTEPVIPNPFEFCPSSQDWCRYGAITLSRSRMHSPGDGIGAKRGEPVPK